MALGPRRARRGRGFNRDAAAASCFAGEHRGVVGEHPGGNRSRPASKHASTSVASGTAHRRRTRHRTGSDHRGSSRSPPRCRRREGPSASCRAANARWAGRPRTGHTTTWRPLVRLGHDEPPRRTAPARSSTVHARHAVAALEDERDRCGRRRHGPAPTSSLRTATISSSASIASCDGLLFGLRDRGTRPASPSARNRWDEGDHPPARHPVFTSDLALGPPLNHPPPRPPAEPSTSATSLTRGVHDVS